MDSVPNVTILRRTIVRELGMPNAGFLLPSPLLPGTSSVVPSTASASINLALLKGMDHRTTSDVGFVTLASSDARRGEMEYGG